MNARHLFAKNVFAALVLLVAANIAAAQTPSPTSNTALTQTLPGLYQIPVTVFDSAGNPIPTATIEMRIHSEVFFKAVDSSAGATLDLPADRWSVGAQADGFGYAGVMVDLMSADGRAIAAKGIRLVLPRYTPSDLPPPARMFTGTFPPKAQPAPLAPATDSLSVTNAISHDGQTITAQQLTSAYKHVTVTVHNAHTNADETYSGVPIDLVLMAAHAPTGSELRGKALTTGVIARGSDGYEVLFSLAEINPAFHSGQVIVADARDGKPLTDDGPFRIIATEDARPARWVRNLVTLTVVSTATTEAAK
jgi:hypothetical protein